MAPAGFAVRRLAPVPRHARGTSLSSNVRRKAKASALSMDPEQDIPPTRASNRVRCMAVGVIVVSVAASLGLFALSPIRCYSSAIDSDISSIHIALAVYREQFGT